MGGSQWPLRPSHPLPGLSSRQACLSLLQHESSLKFTFPQKTHKSHRHEWTQTHLHPMAPDAPCLGAERALSLGSQGPRQMQPAGCRQKPMGQLGAGWSGSGVPVNRLRGLAGSARVCPTAPRAGGGSEASPCLPEAVTPPSHPFSHRGREPHPAQSERESHHPPQARPAPPRPAANPRSRRRPRPLDLLRPPAGCSLGGGAGPVHLGVSGTAAGGGGADEEAGDIPAQES